MASQWFTTWFDSPHYHKLYGYRDDSEAARFVDALIDRLRPGHDAHLLDLGCGAGRHAKHLASKGFQVTPAMVDEFKASLKGQRIVLDEDAFQKDEAFIRAMLHYDIDLALFGVEEARRNLVTVDPQAQAGLAQFPAAVRMTEMARNRTAGGVPKQ